MKTHKNLFKKMVTTENLTEAIMKAARGKRDRSVVIRVLEDVPGHAEKLQEMLLNNEYVPCKCRERLTSEGSNGKERLITSVDFFPDQCIHWAIILVLKPIITNSSYYYSCGCMPKRGVHHGKRAINKWLLNDIKNTKYCAKIDIAKYYQSVQHQYVMSRLRRSIKDYRFNALLEKIVLSYEKGIPIGYLTSQWLGNYMLQDLDMAIKQVWLMRYYARYMDDMMFFSASKRKLHKLIKNIEAELKKIGLRLKSNWQVFPLKSRFLDFMGFRFYRYKTTLRKSLMLRITRRARRVGANRVVTAKNAAAIISGMGWIKHSDSYGLYVKRIKPHVNIGRMKAIVRRNAHDENRRIRIGSLPQVA